MGHQDIDGIDVNEAIAEGPGHMRVDLGDHVLGVRRRGFDDIDGDAETAQAVHVRRGHAD